MTLLQESWDTNTCLAARRRTLEKLRNPSSASYQVAAHRGLRWNGVPDNSLESIRRASQAGCEIVEIDLRLTSDSHVVVFHDDFMGRCTNIAESQGRSDAYSPFTGKGFNPAVDSVSWSMMESFVLKDELGYQTSEKVLDLQALFDAVDHEEIPVILFMDFKDKKTVKETWTFLRMRKSNKWTSYCVWKIDAAWYPMPEDLQTCAWFQEAQNVAETLILPVYRPAGCKLFDYMRSIKAYSKQSFTVTFEIGLRGPGGMLQDAVDFVRSGESKVRGMGCFATYGDLPPRNGRPILFDVDPALDLWALNSRSPSPLGFVENDVPATFDSALETGESPDGHDHRANIDLYRSMGFTWTITDAADLLLKRLENVE